MNKKWLIFPVSLLLLTGCTLIENETNEVQESINQSDSHSQDSESDTESSEKEESTEIESMSEEEKEHQNLIETLPADADIEDWNLILVNNWNPLPDDFEPDLVEVEAEKSIDRRIVDAYDSWMTAAETAGHQLYFASGYRSVERQQNNYNRSINQYIKEGYSKEEAIEKTEEYIAIPKSSEHHTGLAIDIVDQQWIAEGNGLTPDYDTQESQQWLVDTMAEYGFILRYPEDTKELTDINYESWHFRYVGKENAQFIVEHNLVLEKYIELLNERAGTSNE